MKETIYQENVIIMNFYAPNKIAMTHYVKQKVIEL